MIIKVEITTVYGKELIYPICDTAKLLTELSGGKTLTKHAVSIIKQLGYQFEVIAKGLE